MVVCQNLICLYNLILYLYPDQPAGCPPTIEEGSGSTSTNQDTYKGARPSSHSVLSNSARLQKLRITKVPQGTLYLTYILTTLHLLYVY